MEIVKNYVLLLKAEKSEESEDKFEVMLSNHGFQVKHLKTLDFTFKALDLFSQKLASPDLYSAIIFTTPRSVRATKLALQGKQLDLEWYDKPTYVVGETTSALASSELNLSSKGQGSGNASNLAEVILKDKQDLCKPILFPCGNLKTDALIQRLNGEEIQVDAVNVYETLSNSNLSEEFKDATCNFSKIPEYFVYFSPSGVNSTLQYVQQFDRELLPIKFIAIGPTTETALKNNDIEVHSVSVKPTPDDLLKAISSLTKGSDGL